jgi:hypothetical protein
VSDEDYWEGMRLCDLIGKQVVEAMDTHWAALQKEIAGHPGRGGG